MIQIYLIHLDFFLSSYLSANTGRRDGLNLRGLRLSFSTPFTGISGNMGLRNPQLKHTLFLLYARLPIIPLSITSVLPQFGQILNVLISFFSYISIQHLYLRLNKFSISFVKFVIKVRLMMVIRTFPIQKAIIAHFTPL